MCWESVKCVFPALCSVVCARIIHFIIHQTKLPLTLNNYLDRKGRKEL